MATIKQQGNGYKITVSRGYDINGKQLRSHMTWVPEPGMTKRQVSKELNRQATLFEDKIKCNVTQNGSIRLVEFTEKFMKEYAYPNLKKKTVHGYSENMEVVNEAMGHIKLQDLKPGHIASFYANLQEAGIRRVEHAVPKADLSAWLKEHHTSMAALSAKSGISLWTYRQFKTGKAIDNKCALAIAAGMGVNYDDFFVTKRNMEPLAPGTIHAYHRTLSAVLCRAVKWGYISSNPASRVDLPSLTGRKAKYLDEPDARRLLELLRREPIRWRTIMTFDLLSGLRRGELAGLRWQDVDFANKLITVSQTSNYVPKFGIYVDTPKSATSSRPLRLSQSAFSMLLEYKKWQDSQKSVLGDAWKDKDGRIFTGDEGAPLFPDSITKWFTKFVARSGLPKVTVHSMRHTYASLMIADGTPLVIVAHNLGHAQTSTTANIYAHAIASAEAKAAQAFDRFDDVVSPEPADNRPPESLPKSVIRIV